MTDEQYKKATEIMINFKYLKSLKLQITVGEENKLKENIIALMNNSEYKVSFLSHQKDNNLRESDAYFTSLFKKESDSFMKQILKKINSEMKKLEKEYENL